MPNTDWDFPSTNSSDWTKPSVNPTDWEKTGTNSTNWSPGSIFSDYYLLLQNDTDALLYQDDATFIGIQ